jgi:DNA-binding SARP family transcriptional activator
VEYDVLGPLVVRADDGREVALPDLARTLVCALALANGDVVTVDDLVDALWDGKEPPSWRKALQMHVRRTRAVLGDDAIETVAGGYRLGLGAGDTDAAIFEARLRAGEGGRALACWRGRPFDELGEWPPAVAERDRLQTRYDDATDLQCTARVALGVVNSDELATLARAAPEREGRWVLLMTALYRAGREAEALRVFDEARTTLRDRFGLDPGPELTATQRAILDHDLAVPSPDPRARIDRAIAQARVTGRSDEAFRAVTLAREIDDAPRFAAAALAIAGEGWLTGLDPFTAPVVLLAEALDRLGAAPTPLRARVLARLAVAESHNQPVTVAETHSRAALELAYILDDPNSLASALHARLVVDQDLAHRRERRALANELIALSAREREPQWRTWALPILARLDAIEGDVASARTWFAALAAVDDPVAQYHAAAVGVLDATLLGDTDAAIAAAARVRDAGVLALLDPTAAAMAHFGMVGMIEQVGGRSPTNAGPAEIEFPQETMHASYLASRGDLASLTPEYLAALDHDIYWPTLVYLLAGQDLGAARACALLSPAAAVADAHVVDGACIYLGSMHHHVGLLAAATGDHGRSREHLAAAVAAHDAIGAPVWRGRSEAALSHL